MRPMPNIASLLKEEITRLARKELRANTEALKKSVAAYRSQIAALKRRVEVLERQQKKMAKSSQGVRQEVDETEGSATRWSAKGFASHRNRLGLSAADYGALVGVSALTVYKWEAGQVRPRQSHMPAIAAVRKLGKREALLKLEQLAG